MPMLMKAIPAVRKVNTACSSAIRSGQVIVSSMKRDLARDALNLRYCSNAVDSMVTVRSKASLAASSL